jgi:hypothetical protein
MPNMGKNTLQRVATATRDSDANILCEAPALILDFFAGAATIALSWALR